MKVFYAFYTQSVCCGHGDYRNEKIITSPVFAKKEDCEKFINENSWMCSGAKIAEVELQ